jgi:hypothetical protein
MKPFLTLILYILLITIYKPAFGQYISHFTVKDRIKKDTLIDVKSGNKFIVDKLRIYITAIDKNGHLCP